MYLISAAFKVLLYHYGVNKNMETDMTLKPLTLQNCYSSVVRELS